VLLAVAGALVVVLRPDTYRSLALISLDQQSVLDSPDDAGGIGKLSHLREIYGPLLTTASVTEPIAQATGLTEEQVSDRVAALVPKDSLLLGVRGTGSSPGAAQKLTQAAADEMVRYAADTQAAAGVAPSDRVVLSVVTPARPGERATGQVRTIVTVAGFLGLMGAAIGAALGGFRPGRGDSLRA
jgi:hypothetical protein